MIRGLFVSIAANALVLFMLASYLTEYFSVEGGVKAYLVCGLVLGILNGVVRPILKFALSIAALPLLLIGGVFVYIVLNGTLLWLTNYIVAQSALDGIMLVFHQGWWSYVVVAAFFGIVNSLFHFMLRF